jgi:hypothetical protein
MTVAGAGAHDAPMASITFPTGAQGDTETGPVAGGGAPAATPDDRVVQHGRILPFGHRATLTTVATAGPRPWSVLTVDEPARTFDAEGDDGRAWPWVAVRVLDPVSPRGTLRPNPALGHLELAPATPALGATAPHGAPGSGPPFVVRYRATGHDGDEAELALPAFFAASGVSALSAALAWASRPASFRTADLGGRPVRMALPAATSGATSVGPALTSLTVTAVQLQLAPGSLAPRVTSFVGAA